MTPGKPHQYFKKLAGNYKTVSKNYMADPKNPQVTHGTASFRVIMGGRYLQQRFQGDYNGMKFEGMGLTGYDNAQKKYVGVWIDSFGTGVMNFEGQYDAKSKTMNEVGTGTSPMGDFKMRMSCKEVGSDQFLFSMFMVLPDGKESKTMEITYTRVKRAAKKKPKPEKKAN